MESIHKPYQIFDDMMHFYNALLEDILQARKSICIEVFKFHDDFISKRICKELIFAVHRGVDVKILVDGWGTPHATKFFKEFVDKGGKLRIWDKARLTFNWDVILKSHHRNHRKIFTIDNEIAYIGSGNISDYNLEWKELILRACDKSFAKKLYRVFHFQYVASEKIIPNKKKQLQPVFSDHFEILRDTPSLKRSLIKKRYIELINNAQKLIIIETPYFLPSSSLRYALEKAISRNVKIIIITSKHSDVKIVDILRNRYLAPFFEKGADVRLFKPNNIHAKLLCIDQKIFSIGSSNFDYRSFRYQYEVVAIGQDADIINQLCSHIFESMNDSEPFDYDTWKNRNRLEKLLERLIIPIRQLL